MHGDDINYGSDADQRASSAMTQTLSADTSTVGYPANVKASPLHLPLACPPPKLYRTGATDRLGSLYGM